jgi:hypothetical protein
MKDPIFIRPAHEYDSYRDFWNLVELSGFPQCKIKYANLDEDETFIIVPFGGEPKDHIRYRRNILSGPKRARIVWWDLERPDAEGQEFSKEYVRGYFDEFFNYVDEIWVSDRHFCELDPRTKFVVLGGHPKMGTPVHDCPEYDVVHLSYMNYRRICIFEGIKELKIAPTKIWGNEKDHALRSSRAMVNIHQTPAPIMEPLRFALAASYGLPLLSETCADPWPLVEGQEILMAPYEELSDAIHEWLKRPDLDVLGDALRRKLVEEWSFRKGVEAAMKGIA